MLTVSLKSVSEQVFQQEGFGDRQDVQVGIQGSTQTLQDHDSKHHRCKITLQLHLQQEEQNISHLNTQ